MNHTRAKVGGSAITAIVLSLVVGGTSWAPPPPMPPGAPTSVVVTPGDGQAIVTWQGNYAGWGYFPDGYEAKTAHGGPTCSASDMFSTTCTLTGLTNGEHYSVTVHAFFRRGDHPGAKELKGRPSVRVKFVLEG